MIEMIELNLSKMAIARQLSGLLSGLKFRFNSRFRDCGLGLLVVLVIVIFPLNHDFVYSLPPVDDIPEEILRTEIITTARSPIDGKPLTAAEYAQLQAKIQTVPPPKLDPSIREQIFLIQLLKTLKTMFPFLNFF